MQAIEFYKAWDRYGALSNFSPHSIEMPAGAGASGTRTWKTLEHYYQAQKFTGALFRFPGAKHTH